MGEQRYKAVMAVLSGGRTVTEVARDWEVSRQTMHTWLARYERQGMEGMGDRRIHAIAPSIQLILVSVSRRDVPEGALAGGPWTVVEKQELLEPVRLIQAAEGVERSGTAS